MYLEYYGLEQPPFSITPDPHYVFLSEHHRDALAHLLYGIRQGGSGGFVQLTGEVGTGKTTLSRLLLNQLPENTHAALVLNPRLDPVELLETICEELRLRPTAAAPDTAATSSEPEPTTATTGKRKKNPPAKARATSVSRTKSQTARPSAKALYDMLSAYLLEAYARGERVVLIIDEAQNLSTEALEQVRLLTNLETETQKLLQIILIGQPELRETLMRPELRQLAQRITARYHLRPLDEAGTMAYLRHRLNTAGASRFPFSQDAVRRLHRRSGGVPRLINVVAERALLGGYAHDLLTIDAKTVDRAADEALAPTAASAPSQRRLLIHVAWMTAAIAGFAALLMAWPFSKTKIPNDASIISTSAPAPAPAPASIIAPANGSNASNASNASLPAATSSTASIDALSQRIRDTAPNASREWSSLLDTLEAPAALRKTVVDACPAAPAAGWRCLRSRASLDQLVRFDRPVLLRLRIEPHAAWARLLGTHHDRVRLSLGGRTLEIDRVALPGVWNGEFLAIWAAPDALEARYAANDAGAIAWVRERLQRDGAIGDDIAKNRATALRAFQARYGLLSDGRLHAETIFALATRSDGPRLSRTDDNDSVE